MTDIDQSGPSGLQPGKTRTWWHPLLVRMLSFALDSAFKVEEEVSVGKLPLQVDILLIRREGGQLAEDRAGDLAELLPLLNRFTLIEFKGPTDATERGDFARLLGCACLWLSQQDEPVSHHEVSLIFLAPAVNAALREGLRLLGGQVSPHESGIFRVAGLPFAAWLVESDVMADRGRLILALVSRVFLNDRRSIIERLAQQGPEALAHYRYIVQQVQQFRPEEDLAMQQAVAENLKQFDKDLEKKWLKEIPLEERLDGLSPEERLEGLSPEERLRGLSPDELLQALPAEFVASLDKDATARLRALWDKKQN